MVGGTPLTSRGNVYIFTVDKAASVISVVGEPDVVRQMSTLPGVAMGMEGSLGLFVRGGNSSNCRLEVDGVPLYNATHAFGLMSSVQPESIGTTRIYTGGFSASQGNFTSGLIDTSLKSGSNEKFGASATFSPYIDGIYLETPGRVSVHMGARYSPLPFVAGRIVDKYRGRISLLDNFSDDFSIGGGMWDFNASVNFKLNDKTNLKAVFFSAQDRIMTMDNAFRVETGWNTWMGKIGLNRSIGEFSELNVSFYATGSDSFEGQEKYTDKGNLYSSVSVDSHIKEFCLQGMFRHTFAKRYSFNGGMEFKRLMNRMAVSAFGEVGTSLGSKVDINLGVRPTVLTGNGFTRANIDAHLLTNVWISDCLGLQFTFDRMNQYFHVLEGLPAGWALNLTVPIEEGYPEETANQIYAGWFTRTRTRNLSFLGAMDINFNLGVYYKCMSNMVSYVSSVNMLRNRTDHWQTDTDCGTGRSYGLEMSLILNSDRLSANAAYTLSHTDRTFSMINMGERFPFKFDRPHILNLQMDVMTVDRRARNGGNHISQHAIFDLSLYSGNRMTVAVAQYEAMLFPYGWETSSRFEENQEQILFNLYNRTEMTAVNGFRTPAYFRIDLGYSFVIQRPKVTHELAVTVYNVLNRHNPYMIYNDFGTWKQISILPILPSFRWKITF